MSARQVCVATLSVKGRSFLGTKEMSLLCMLAQHHCMTCIAEYAYLHGITNFHLTSILQC